MMHRKLWPLAAVSLSACAWTPEVRDLADNTGVFVSSLETGTGEFVANQSRLNARNAQRLDQLFALGSAERASMRQQRLAWTDSGDGVRLATHDAATEITAERIIEGLELKATAPPELGPGAVEAYGKSRKALAAIMAGPKPGAELIELITIGQQVYGKYGELDKAAKADAEATDTQSSKVDDEGVKEANASKQEVKP